MAPRSSLSIRRLMSPPRRFSEEDVSGVGIEQLKNRNEVYLDAWLDHHAGTGRKRAYHRKVATEPIIATSALTHSDIVRPLPPLPSETPRSSASSLCRCERHCEADCPLTRDRERRRSPLCSRVSKDGSEDSSLLSLPSTNGSDMSPVSRLPRSRFYHPESYEDLTRPSSFEKDPIDENRAGNVSPSHRGHFSLDVQNFIEETERAFKDDLRLTEISLSQNTKPAPLNITPKTDESTPPPPPPKEKPPLPAKDPRRNQTQQKPVLPHPNTPPLGPPPALTVARKKSKKAKKTKAKAIAMKAQRKAAAPRLAVRNVPRWTLTDNVSELLTGKLFHKIEADEMLTPDQIEAYRLRRVSERQAQEQTNEDEPADTPVEPFYLDELSARIGSPTPPAGNNSEAETSGRIDSNEKPAIAFSDDVVTRDFSFERPPSLAVAPLRLSRLSKSAPRKPMADLPVIPEAATVSPRNDELSLGPEQESVSSLLQNDESVDSEFVFLQSSPCSLTAPAFKHGSIRLAKSDLMPDPMLGIDEVLDWTAFQMAILGGAGGDWFSDSDDTIRRREAEDVNQLTEWWDSWQFGGAGDLVTHPDFEASSPTSTISGEELPDPSVYDGLESDTPYESYHPWQTQSTGGHTQKTHKAHGLGINIDLARGGKPVPSDFMMLRDNEQKEKSAVSRDSLMSLPPSPMLDLRVIRSDDGEMDVVPMGFNLGHDLGDYLKWETEHAFAGDFN